VSGTGEPWGMSATQFLASYLGLCLLLYVANVLAWRWARGRAAGRGDGAVHDVYEHAILNGGPQLAILVAVTMLRRQGLLAAGTSASRLVAAEGELGAGAHELERTVFEVVRRSPQISAESLRHELAHWAAIERMVCELTQSGLLIERRRVAWARLLWLAGPPLLVTLGVARLVVAWDYGDTSTRYLLVAVILTCLVVVEHAVEQLRYDGRPFTSANGTSVLDRRRGAASGESEDDPHARVALAVALSGAPALWNVDPILAASLGVVREHAPVEGRGSCGCG
jgi:uncharacterized protein (TIGR04222 family)